MHPIRRWLNRAGGVLLLGLCIVALWGVIIRLTSEMYPQVQSIAHAGGRIGGQVYTNSLAAFNQAYARGFRMIEVDFLKTADGVVVCGHDWYDFDATPSYQQFLQRRTLGPFQSCTFTELLEWLDRHPDVLLISDAKIDVISINQALHDSLGVRLLAQAYNVADVRLMHEAGISNIILTLYRAGNRNARLDEISAIAASGIKIGALTMPAIDALTGAAIFAKSRLEVPVYTHTINACWLSKVFWALGVDAVYTDDLGPDGCSTFNGK
jgi:glycerophosphoryl diester phosphodiesterase